MGRVYHEMAENLHLYYNFNGVATLSHSSAEEPLCKVMNTARVSSESCSLREAASIAVYITSHGTFHVECS